MTIRQPAEPPDTEKTFDNTRQGSLSGYDPHDPASAFLERFRIGVLHFFVWARLEQLGKSICFVRYAHACGSKEVLSQALTARLKSCPDTRLHT
jgi:hypothetical protein